MQRRAVLRGCAAALTGFAGCIGGDNSDEQGSATADGTPTRTAPEDGENTPNERGSATPDRTPTATESEKAFRASVSDAVEGRPSFTFEEGAWSVSYHYDLCCAAENLRPHQLALARNFTAVQPEGVTVALTTTHECQVVEWEVPPDVARRYREGELSEDGLADHIAESSERTESC